VESSAEAAGRALFDLRSEDSGQRLTVVVPPDTVEILPSDPPALDRRELSPFGVWQLRHELISLATSWNGFAAVHAGRVQLEPYQLLPTKRILTSPHASLLIADDVGLGKTIEAGLCLVELMARGIAGRVLLVVPPGLIDQWLEEMHSKFGLEFAAIRDSASLDHAQTGLAEGISPWSFHDRIITSTEYLKQVGVYPAVLRRPWDVIVVDEAHYLAESGSPASPYSTRRTRLGARLRSATRSLILLTATPHNGYRHSFRSLLELIEPTDASLEGDGAAVARRVGRCMVRRLKRQITRTGPSGERVPAFVPRAPVERIEVRCETAEERQIFALVSNYCVRTAAAAAETEQRDLVSFAMQIVKKRMLSSRLALTRTVMRRLEALKEVPEDTGPSRSELHELESDLPLPEQEAERIVERVLRSSVPADSRRRNAEKKQLKEIQKLLEKCRNRPDPKIEQLLSKLRTEIAEAGEKAIVFTEYRDTLEGIREALEHDPLFSGRFAELPGGLTPRQRRDRIAQFASPDCKVLIATDAASEGLNLQQHCRNLYHVELPWNPNRLEQRNGRIDRYGQQRTPRIAYLFYGDSPEDQVLERLIHRISEMHDDRVSTPDILGLVETIRLPERLLEVSTEEDGERASESLARVFEEERAEFLREVAPFLAVGDSPESLDPASADPLLSDDLQLERVLLRLLGDAARPTGPPHEYRVRVPPSLRGPGVADEYPALTWRRSVALTDGMSGTEFSHRLHPLVRAAARDARTQLCDGTNASPPARLAVRRLVGEDVPAVVFTFLDRNAHPDGAVMATGVHFDGSEMDREAVARALSIDGPIGEVRWSECERTFAARFEALRSTARERAVGEVRRRAAKERERRARIATELRAEVERYRADRAEELDREEALERAGTRGQTELFREVRTDWAARRAAVATQAETRLKQIAGWAEMAQPTEPEPLGALIVFPEGGA
jgi:superfamily II DNA or RNA helicase